MLLTNGSLLNGNPGRRLGVFMLNDSYKDSSFQTRNTNQSNVDLVSIKSGLPNGYSGSKAWVQPRKTGGLSMPLGETKVTTAYTANIAGGRNATLPMNVDFSMALSGALVTGATLIMNTAVGLSANVIGKLNATLSLATSANMTASLSALAGAVLALNTTASMTADLRAKANLTLDITPFAELSAENLAKAVWNYTASLANNPGSTGEALNDAAVGGGGGGTIDPQDIRDAMTLSTAETPATGSIDDKLAKIKTETGLIPAAL